MLIVPKICERAATGQGLSGTILALSVARTRGAFVVAIRAFHARGQDVVLADVQRERVLTDLKVSRDGIRQCGRS